MVMARSTSLCCLVPCFAEMRRRRTSAFCRQMHKSELNAQIQMSRWKAKLPIMDCSPLLLLIALFFVFLPSANSARQLGSCKFPSRWEGTWFQSGVRQPIVIEGDRASFKGRCIASEGDKFLMVDDKGICFRCVVIHEKHHNVLQYKETYCHSKEALPNLCSLITGDALLYSMFRVEASPVQCPFRGPFTFSYNRGHGECRSPPSSVDSCTEDSRLLLRYQACPDVSGTESTVEELQCLATWKEGSSRYLVGLVHHSHATSNEDRYRCFVYEKATEQSPDETVDYWVAQSGDATCNGLFTPMEGSRTMILRKAPSPNKCKFPNWITMFPHWHTLDYRRSYQFHHRNTTLKIANASDGGEMRVVCSEDRHVTAEVAHIVTHVTSGCQSGYVCMMFYRRDAHVIELQTGLFSRRPEEACHSHHFDKNTLPYVTLVTSSPESRDCPYSGRFSVLGLSQEERRSSANSAAQTSQAVDNAASMIPGGCSPEFTSLRVGCTNVDTMEFRSECTRTDTISAYSCHGGWEDNGTHFLITTPLSRTSHGARRLCFIYRESALGVHFSSSAVSCQRDISPGVGGILAFNVTSSGNCMEENSSAGISPSRVTLSSAFVLLISLSGIFNR
ncbi:uncharacterized protein LOC132201685 isoform X2 [Neocloeon triangulifer]|uniref:uncharacterized protein LOC132201685 isoform X2 n=1 Tax=Neocloeon triangulifer TaxID=2078957 RepID=UPI00286F6DB4|nr:uncharacterized protein LOC132201685 isoform X2 [Neocloeon triangulifer]